LEDATVESKQPVSVRNLRRPKGHISSVATNMLHLKNPWVTAWWSAAFPGFGHIILGSYVKGFLLVVWELLINVKAKLNLCILYSFGGQYELARQVVDTRWLLLYAPVYVFAIWDAYRRTVDLNKKSVLADREDSIVLPSKINTIEINTLDKKHPWLAMVVGYYTRGGPSLHPPGSHQFFCTYMVDIGKLPFQHPARNPSKFYRAVCHGYICGRHAMAFVSAFYVHLCHL